MAWRPVRKVLHLVDMNASATVAQKIDSSPPGTFLSASDIKGVPRTAVDIALSRAVRSRKDLVRVSRGTYWKGRPTRFGPGRPDAVTVARSRAGDRGVGPTGWLAANELGLSTQVPAHPELVTVGRPPKGVSGVKFSQRSNLDRVDLNYLDIGLLEVLRSYPHYANVTWQQLADRVRDLSRQRVVDVDAVAKVAAKERSIPLKSNVQRLMATLAEA